MRFDLVRAALHAVALAAGFTLLWMMLATAGSAHAAARHAAGPSSAMAA